MAYWESDPILFAIDNNGSLTHVDAVPNGSACGCVCPSCQQPLIAKNGGTKLVHHFAHKKGACTWAAEAAITFVSYDVLQKHSTIPIKEAYYLEYDLDKKSIVHPYGEITVTGVELVNVKGRQAPLISVNYEEKEGQTDTFFLAIVVTHPFTQENINALDPKDQPILEINFKNVYAGLRDEYGRHFSRGEFFFRIQDPEYIKSILIGEADVSLDAIEWIYHPAANRAEKETRERRHREWLEEREAEKRAWEAELEKERLAAEYKRQAEERQRQDLLQGFIKREIESFEAQGVETLPLVKEGVHFFADGCPLYGRANVVRDCGDFVFNKDKCIFFEGKGYYVIGCTAHQNGVGLEDE